MELHYSNDYCLHLINPAMKQPFPIPPVSRHNRVIYQDLCGIAYCAASTEYKVTLPYTPSQPPLHLDIVTIGVDKSWSHVQVNPLS